MDHTSPLSQLSAAQRQALYDRAKREAIALRREAIGDFLDQLTNAVRRAVRRAMPRHHPRAEAAACPR